MKLDNYCIYVKNYSEWIDIQKYLFSQGYRWIGSHDQQLFTKWEKTEIIFPRNLLFSYIENNNNWYLTNVYNSAEHSLSNPENFKEIKALDILRSDKLKKLNK